MGPGAGASLPSAQHQPYLDWLFHTLVEEVEGTGPLHPEEKGMPGFVKGGTGRGCGKGSGWGWRPQLTEGEQICWVVELEGEKGVHLDQELTWGWRAHRGQRLTWG